MKNEIRLTMPKGKYSPIICFLDSGIEPDGVCKLTVTRACIDRMLESRNLTKHGNDVYSHSNVLINGVRRERVSFKITLTRNGYTISYIKISGNAEQQGARYEFPGKKAMSTKLKVLVEY